MAAVAKENCTTATNVSHTNSSKYMKQDEGSSDCETIHKVSGAQEAEINYEEHTSATRHNALDRGWGWVIVAGGFVAQILNGLSFISFGILYMDLVIQFGGKSGPIGWIGALFAFVGNICAIPTSIIIDIYGCRNVTFAAGLCLSLGFMLSSFATNGVMILITYGLIGGFGSGSCLISCLVIVQQYFDRHRALAAGLLSSGLSIGTLIAGPLVQFLIDMYGWRGAMILEAGLFLHLPLVALLFRPITQYSKVTPNKTQGQTINMLNESRFLQQFKAKLRDVTIMKDIRFLLMCVNGLLTSMPVCAFLLHCPSHAVFRGVDRHIASTLLTIIGSAALVANVGCGFVANLRCVNRVLLYSIGTMVFSAIMMLYTLATTVAWIAIGCVAIGLTLGGVTAITSTAIVDLVGILQFPRAMALFMIFYGIGSLLATPIVGYILDVTHSYSVGLVTMAGCGVIGGGVTFVMTMTDICRVTSHPSLGARMRTMASVAGSMDPHSETGCDSMSNTKAE